MQTTRGAPLRRRTRSVDRPQPDASTSDRESAAPTEPPEPPARPRVAILIGVAAVVLVLDVISKIVVVATLSDHAPVRLLGGAVFLEETRNGGAAFSVGGSATFVFAVVAIGVIVVILRTARRLYSGAWAAVLGLLLGGATGNLIDRLVRSPGVFRGHVVDWIRVPHFAVFNLADSAITVGGVLAVLLAITGRQLDGTIVKARPSAPPDRNGEPDGAPDDQLDAGTSDDEQP